MEHRDRADRVYRLIIEDRFPGEPAVPRLPDSAGGGPDVDDLRVRFHRLDVGDAAAHAGWADGAGFHARQQLGIHLGAKGPGQRHTGERGRRHRRETAEHKTALRILIQRLVVEEVTT